MLRTGVTKRSPGAKDRLILSMPCSRRPSMYRRRGAGGVTMPRFPFFSDECAMLSAQLPRRSPSSRYGAYAPVQGGTFLHAGVYSMRKAGKELTKTRGVDPKRVSPNEEAGRLLVEKALEAMEKEYHPKFPIFISLPIRDLVTIGQALMACENKRDMWTQGFAGRWAPPI